MTTPSTRAPAVAGMFYPADPALLRRTVEQALAQAAAGRDTGAATPPKALIAPHAGYRYSGPVAAAAYATVLPLRGQVERVVILGPAHTVPLAAVAASEADAFAGPLGAAPVDSAAVRRLVDAGLVVVSDEAHAAEHAIEVQLPFVQVALGDVHIVPLVVGEVPARAVADVLDAVWGGPETLIVVSTDLSHYHDHRTATELDRRTAATILATRPEALGRGDACGLFALRGFLAAAERRQLEVDLLRLATSADTAGDPDRVVGYGAFAFA